MHIGQMAQRGGVSIDAIRFYERSDILAAAPRTAGGFRVYTEEDIAAVRFVRRAQRLGFSLDQIRDLLALRRSDIRACAPVRDRLQGKLSQIRLKIHELHQLERELRIALRSCRRQLRKKSPRCPLLAASSKSTREASQ